MTGPDHYREGERLLEESRGMLPGSDSRGHTIAAARAHFEAAQVAAFVEAATFASNGRPLCALPLPAGEGDPAYPGNQWGRALAPQADS